MNTEQKERSQTIPTPCSTDEPYSLEKLTRYLSLVGTNELILHWLDKNPGIDNLDGHEHFLHLSLEANNEVIARWLINHKIGIETENALGMLPIHVAAQKNQLPLLPSLIAASKALLECEDNQHLTALYYAIQNESIAAVKLLMSAKINILSCIPEPYFDESGSIPEAFELDEEQRSDISEPILHPHPLKICYEKDNLELFSYLVSFDKKLCNDEDKNTPLHYAALYGSTEIMDYILEGFESGGSRFHVPVDKLNSHQESSLIVAMRAEHLPCVALLLNNHAKLPAFSAQSESIKETIRLFKEKYNNTNYPEFNTLFNAAIELPKEKNKADLTILREATETPDPLQEKELSTTEKKGEILNPTDTEELRTRAFTFSSPTSLSTALASTALPRKPLEVIIGFKPQI